MLAPSFPRASDGSARSAKRRKVTRACDRCKSLKRKCNGDQPCALCTARNAECAYDSPYSRGRQVVPGDRSSVSLNQQSESSFLDEDNALDSHRRGKLGLDAALAEESNANGLSRSSRASPSGEGIGQPGHYLGPTSTFSFLRRAGRRFGRLAGEARDSEEKLEVSIFANGDNSFSDVPQGAIVDLPDHTIIDPLVGRYFDFAVPSHRFFHQPTVAAWVHSLHGHRNGAGSTLYPVREAIVYLIMATALLYPVDSQGNATDGKDVVTGQRSEKLRELYFNAAQARLKNEKGVARLESVQARLASVLYLLNTSRLNQAWYMLGTTSQLVVALGLHRSRSSAGTSQDCIIQECKKRCYWVAFTVDTYLAVMLGRPPLMSEQGVDQSYPALVNDENVTSASVSHGAVVRDCVQAAPIFHARLAKIIREASAEQYHANKAPSERQIDTAQRLTQHISEWHKELPVFLSGGIHPATLVPIFRRQLRVLQMAAAHATMIVNRPLILSSHHSAESRRPHVDQCLAAARKVLGMVLELVDQNHLFKAFWNFQYIAFHALSVVYVWVIQLKRDPEPALHAQQDKQHLYDLAERVQGHLAEATQLNAPNLRYSIILEELKQEASKALNGQQLIAQHIEPAIQPVPDGIDRTRAQTLEMNSLSDWDSLLDFPTDPELWLQLDAFPYDDFIGVDGGSMTW